MAEMESPENSFYLNLSDDKFNPIAIKFNWHLSDLMNTGDVRDRMEKEGTNQLQVLTELFSWKALEFLSLSFLSKYSFPPPKNPKVKSPNFQKLFFHN